MNEWLASGIVLAASVAVGAEVKPLQRLNQLELEVRQRCDAQSVQVHRQGLRSVITFVRSRPDLFPASRLKESRLLRREEKEVVWTTWQRFLDYVVALDSTERYHARFLRLKGDAREDSFLIGYAALLAQYRAALEFVERAENHAELDKILNEPVPEIGLPAGTYAKLKVRFLNVAIATEFAAREAVLPTFTGDRQPALGAAIREDAAQVWAAGKGRGEMLTLKNAWKVIERAAGSAWLPIQAGVSEWMGDTQVYRAGRSLISQAQIRELQPRLEPGDILLERREWYLSNIGLPGFWSHAALYLGTPEQRRSYFTDADTRAWIRTQGIADGDLEMLLRTRYPTNYEASLRAGEEGHRVRVIEAISEGVSFTTLEHSADCDSLAVLRPRLPRREKAQAILRAFHYAGRPYDFNFDFATDAELVCTELVYKAYEPAEGFRGLRFPLIEMLGRKVTPANELAKQFDAQSGTGEQPFDLVLFLDGQERQKRAVEASIEVFRESWKRPKWHVLAQGHGAAAG
jgi:hypothetical protein